MSRWLSVCVLAACACGGSSRGSEATVAPSSASPASPAASRFKYDAATGACVDGAGQAGLNKPNPAVLFVGGEADGKTYANGDGECVDFSNFDFGDHIGAGYPTLSKWNFRGARFTKARFLFANMKDVDLSGADLS